MQQGGGRKKRQIPGCTPLEGCGNTSFAIPQFEDLNFTDDQRQFCNNIRSCLFDLALTGNEELAGTTRNFDENITSTVEILSE